MTQVAVVTPYFREPLEMLRRCHESVLAQDMDVTHFMVADGFPNAELKDWVQLRHVVLPAAHADNGNTPRGLGATLAEAEGFQFVAFLDADNWYHLGHLKALLKLWQDTRADICCSARTFHDDEGLELAGVFDQDELAHTHVDTSCLLIHQRAYESHRIWLKMPKQLSPVCDRVFFQYIRQRYRIAFTTQKTVAFRTQYASHFRAAGREPPSSAKTDVGAEPYRWMRTLEGVRTTVQRLGFYPG